MCISMCMWVRTYMCKFILVCLIILIIFGHNCRAAHPYREWDLRARDFRKHCHTYRCLTPRCPPFPVKCSIKCNGQRLSPWRAHVYSQPLPSTYFCVWQCLFLCLCNIFAHTLRNAQLLTSLTVEGARAVKIYQIRILCVWQCLPLCIHNISTPHPSTEPTPLRFRRNISSY